MLNSTTQGACIKIGGFGSDNPTITLNTVGNSSEAMITLEESTGTSVGLELGIEGSDFKGGIISMYETTQGISTLVISGGVSDSANSYIGSNIEMKRRKNDGTSIISPFTFDAPNLEMVLRNDNSGASVSFGMSTSQTNATNFILPTSNGISGYVLETDGSGNTSWVVQSGGGGTTSPSGPENSVQFNSSSTFTGTSSFQFFEANPSTTGGVCALTVDGNVFSSMGVCDATVGGGTYQITATEFVNGFVFPPCQSSDENQLFVVQVPSYSDITTVFSTDVLKVGQTFDTVIYGTSIGSSPAIGMSFPSDITVLESTDNTTIFDRRLASDKTISGGLSFHFADATLAYYQGVVIRSRMGSAGVSMYPYATSFYTC